MPTWVARFDDPASAVDGSPRVAVKDAIDMAGVVTAAGCRAVLEDAAPALSDAECLAGIRAAGAAIVGKTGQTELCLSPAGLNRQFGTPVNPAAPDRIPGGSSSGSAVAVADGEADIALGTDTGGSVRIPAACCGIVGLKTTWGRVSTTGVWPLAPTLDTVGPLARDVAGIIEGMRLLEPGWTVAPAPARTVGRLRIDGVDPATEDAIDAALDASGLDVRPVRLSGWLASFEPFDTIILAEFWRAHHALVDDERVGDSARSALRNGSKVTDEQLAQAMAARRVWQAQVAAVLADVELLALPTLLGPPPKLTEVTGFRLTRLTAPVNLAGNPALALPVPAAGAPVPASLQLVGPPGGEDRLCATGLLIEQLCRFP